MADKPTFKELKNRLNEAKSWQGYDERTACCWQGYIAALLEWGLISVNDHKTLSDMVPVQDPDPTYEIFTGYDKQA